MWTLGARTELGRAAAAAGYFAAVALLVLLQEVGLKLRREERRAWWAGNGRDLLNALGLAGVTGALVAFGFPAPAALVVGATVTLLLFGTSVFLERQSSVPHPRAWALAAGVALAAPVLAWPGELLGWLGALVARLFGG